MKSRTIIKSNIFQQINNYMSTDIVKQVFKWRDSKISGSLDSKMRTVQHEMLNGELRLTSSANISQPKSHIV